MDATVSGSPFIPALPSAVKYQSSQLQSCRILMLLRFVRSLRSSLQSMSLSAQFPGLCETCKVFRGSLAAVAFMLCWGTFSGSLAPLCPSSPLPALTVGGLISEIDKLYSLLLSLQPLSRWRAASVNTDGVLIALGNQQSWRPLMEHAQLKIPLKSCFFRRVKCF